MVVPPNAAEVVQDVKRRLRIPVAVKLAPLYTAFAHFARQLDAAGADGLVLFTRFHRVDIDVDDRDSRRDRRLEAIRTLHGALDSGELEVVHDD